MEEKFMREAIALAKKAKKKGEVPIGAVVVYQGKIVGRGYNLRTRLQMATAHAEMRAIDRACKKLHSWRLPEAEIYVTLEPCPMCMGAALNARIDRIRRGACGRVCGSADVLFHRDARAGTGETRLNQNSFSWKDNETGSAANIAADPVSDRKNAIFFSCGTVGAR